MDGYTQDTLMSLYVCTHIMYLCMCVNVHVSVSVSVYVYVCVCVCMRIHARAPWTYQLQRTRAGLNLVHCLLCVWDEIIAHCSRAVNHSLLLHFVLWQSMHVCKCVCVCVCVRARMCVQKLKINAAMILPRNCRPLIICTQR